jgi:16S rRNA processing protein RimM
LIDNLQQFLLELGRGFAFVSRQQRLVVEEQDFYIDLVFYNFKLKCFLLIDLKLGKLTHQDVGQMDTYVRIYDKFHKSEDDNPTIGDFMEDLFQVGVITAPHGVRGEVKVFPTTDDNARFKNLKTVLLDQGRGTRELEIEGVKFFKNMVILKFKGIDDRNDVERMRQAKLLVTRENAVELGKDEYFIADLIGIQVVSDEGEELGTISDVLQTGANDVYVVSKDGAKDLLIPAIHACIQNVDVAAGQMEVHLLPGLR